MGQIYKDITLGNESVAAVTFRGFFSQNAAKIDAVIEHIQRLLSGKNTADQITVNQRVQYEKAGPLIAFRFIDPAAPKISETMITIMPHKGHEDKFNDIFAIRMSSSFAHPETPKKKKTPDAPRPKV